MAVGVAAATAALFAISRGKWSYAMVDSGREWIVPDALAHGDLLYRDVVYWFGPFTPYFHAAWFALLGSGFRTLVLAGVFGSALALGALHLALRQVTGRAEAWLWAFLAIPALVFMPDAGGAILGMGYRMWHAAAFGLAGIAVAARTGKPAVAGLLCALAGLCRTEWGLVSLAAAGLALVARGASRSRRPRPRDLLWLATSFAVLFGGVLAAFAAVAGPDALLADGHLLLTGLPPETRRALLNLSGFHDPGGGLLRMLFAAAAWGAVFLAGEIVAAWRQDPDRLRRRLPALGGALTYLLLYRDYAGTGSMLAFSAAPLVAAAAMGGGLRLRGGRRAAALLGFGLAALALSSRKPFNIGDSKYVAPPLLFGFVCAAALLCEAVRGQRIRAVRLRLRAGARVALVLLTAIAFLARARQYAADPRVRLAETDGMLSALPAEARGLREIVHRVRAATAREQTLVVVPEGELLNYLTGRRNPARYKLYVPGYLTDANELAVVSELERTSPDAILVLDRPTPEYGRRDFGRDYGRRLARWIEARYAPASVGEGAETTRGVRLWIRRP
jgi:hypothetical protein